MNFDKIFNDEEKKKILLASKDYELIRGYCFPVPSSDCHEYTIIELDDAKPIIDRGPQDYFWNKHSEEARDLESAWECFIDYIYDDLDTDEDNVVEKYLRELLQKGVSG